MKCWQEGRQNAGQWGWPVKMDSADLICSLKDTYALHCKFQCFWNFHCFLTPQTAVRLVSSVITTHLSALAVAPWCRPCVRLLVACESGLHQCNVSVADCFWLGLADAESRKVGLTQKIYFSSLLFFFLILLILQDILKSSLQKSLRVIRYCKLTCTLHASTALSVGDTYLEGGPEGLLDMFQVSHALIRALWRQLSWAWSKFMRWTTDLLSARDVPQIYMIIVHVTTLIIMDGPSRLLETPRQEIEDSAEHGTVK